MKQSPQETTGRLISLTFPRISLCLAVLSAVLWYTSWPSFWPGFDIPNCVKARWHAPSGLIGFLSNERLSSFFVTIEVLDPLGLTFHQIEENVWSEDSDGHYCGQPVPPSWQPPVGLSLNVNTETISWTIPYWLMAVLWTIVAWKSRNGLRLEFVDLLIGMTSIVILFVAIYLKVALLLAAPLNLLTAWMCFILFCRAVSALAKDGNPFWPFIVSKNSVGEA